jgi:signal transduction histidine kinase
LNYCVETVSRRKGPVACPMLLECDFRGRVLWMSSRTRMVLQNPEYLSDAIVRPNPLPPATRAGGISPLSLWAVWESPGSVVIGAETVEPEPGETRDLLRIQSRLSLHFLHLLRLERRLFVRAQQGRRRGGRKAVRQIEMERQRLGRELHTGVGQALAAIRLQLEVIAAELPVPSDNVAHALRNIATLTADSMEQVRSLSRRLHPPDWQRLTLESAIRHLWDISGVPQCFEASLSLDPLPWEPYLEVKILFYRGLQEALSNLVRHSRATRIDVTLELRDDQLLLSIRDNGVGFDAEQVFSAQAGGASGIGLRAIREAAQDLGGRLTVESGPNGTKLVVSVTPFPAES